MGIVTSRVGLIKPSEDDFKQVQALNDNSDKLDASLGTVWVADNALPTVQFHGAAFKEITSGREFVLKSDGLGGYTKIENIPSSLGVVRHYTTALTTSLGTATALSGAWNTIPGSNKTYHVDRNALASVRFTVDATSPSSGGTQNFHYRISGFATSQTGPYRIPINTRYGVTSGAFLMNLTQNVDLTMILQFFNDVQTNTDMIAVAWYVDTTAILT